MSIQSNVEHAIKYEFKNLSDIKDKNNIELRRVARFEKSIKAFRRAEKRPKKKQ